MRFCVLGSGSKGNAILVASADTALLIDAGFSGKEMERRLQLIGYSLDRINAILVTHEHRDHISGVGVLSRRGKLPVYANPATHRQAEAIVGELAARFEFNVGEKFVIRDLSIHPFSISHDTADPVGFVITDGRLLVGCCTDTGKVTKLLAHHLRRCHGLVLEANHDPQMLMDGPYPLRLKQRIRSNQGHLANDDAADLLAELAGGHLQQVVLAHLSDTNNHPDLALAAVKRRLTGKPLASCVEVATQDCPGSLIELDSMAKQ